MRHLNKAIALLLILAVAMCSLLVGEEYTSATPSPPIPAISKNQEGVSPKVVFFGSSTIAGAGASRCDRRWTTLLSRYLGWQEINEGLSGSTLTKVPSPKKSPCGIPSAVERLQAAVFNHHPDLVVMMYGANDIGRRTPLGPTRGNKEGTFRGDLKTLLTKLHSAIPPNRLIVLTPQPNPAIKKIRTPYDLAMQEGALKIGSHFLDPGSKAVNSSELSAYSADGFHPNSLGHAAIASFLAGAMVDIGLVPPPPAAQGGNELAGKLVPLPGGYLHIDLDGPLKFGEIRAIEAQWVASGQAVLAVMRPDGRGGYEAVYRTSRFSVSPGSGRIEVPRWWVLDGDLLAVWTEGDCLGASELPSGSVSHISFSYGVNADIHDLPPNAGMLGSRRLALRTVV